MIHPGAEVHGNAIIHPSANIWPLAQVREGAVIGADSSVGRGAYVGTNVRIGDNCKIQNNALVYEPARIENGVFVGPGAILTNDRFPRAVTPDGSRKSPADWTPVGVSIREGASVGAGAICVAPLTIGRWAVVGAGAVVTRDVADFSLVAGNPARHVGWVGRAGCKLVSLEDQEGRWLCPLTGSQYQIGENGLIQELS